MTVLTIAIDEALDVETRLNLKDQIAAEYRELTYTRDEIGVDVVPASS